MCAIKAIERAGDVGQYAIPIGVSGYALVTGRGAEALTTGILGSLMSLEVKAMKRFFPKERPAPYLEGQVSRKDRESFPSSHTTGAFLAVGLSWGIYGFSDPVTLTTVALATLVGTSRYVSHKHWPSDIVAGAIIGTAHGLAASYMPLMLGLESD